MDSRFNIPAPAVVKLGSDVSVEMGRRLKVAVGPAHSDDLECSMIRESFECAGRGRGGFGQSGSIKAGTKKNFRVFPR